MGKLAHSDIVDGLLVTASMACLVVYHIFLFYKVRTRPMHTLIGINHKARRLWVNEMLTDNYKKNVLVVQTLRNTIMESTLFATTAILLTAGVATFYTFGTDLMPLSGRSQAESFSSTSSTQGSQWSSSASLSMTSVPRTIFSTSIVFLLVSCYFGTFLCHTQSIRFINHVNFMVNIPMDQDINHECVENLLERGTIMYNIGCRVFYISFPLLVWVFGSIPMFLFSLALLHSFYNSDFVSQPREKCNKIQNDVDF